MGKLEGAEELAYGAYPAQLRMLLWVLKLRETLSSVQGMLKRLLAFLGKNPRLFRD
jgi:hypothetical protein